MYNVQFTIKLALLLFTFYILHFTFYITPAYALAGSATEIGYSKIHPASPFYFLKAVREYFELKFAGTRRVWELRQLEFATRRLREARTLIPTNQDLIQPTLERYIAHLKTLTDKRKENDEVGTRIKESLNIHLQVLEQMHKELASPKAKMVVRSVMNRVIERADVSAASKKSICEFFQKEASSSGLNQTEQVVLSQRAQKCLDQVKLGFEIRF